MQFPPALSWCGPVIRHAGAPMSHHPGHGVGHRAMCKDFPYWKAQVCSKGYHGTFPVCSLQLAAFFQWFWFAPQETTYHTCLDKSLLTGVGQCYTLWESCPAELGCPAAMWCTCGHEKCVFPGQNSRYPQSSRFPQLSCAKPLKSIVFLLTYPVLRNRQAWNSQQQTWTWRKCMCSAVCRSCSGDQLPKPW